MPTANLTFSIESGFSHENGRRPKIGPGKFLLARPAQTHRFSDPFCQPRGLHGTFAGIFSTEGCAEVRNNHTYVLFAHVQRAGNLRAMPERTLCSRPDGHFA